ncbi:MAG: hypothetical protein KKF54_01635, partial [Candidatus Omnitrophica bacterium]|nr:hypothetical protein [Candidatus Omnitrophota bacterium]
MNRKVMSLIVDGISLSVIGLLVFFYSLYSYRFAVTSLQPSFLNFPVFIGEIVLGVCLTLLIVKYVVNRTPIKFNRNIYIGIAFLIFIFIKTAYGYVKWGPLALRNSALFYYFLYAVIGYSIYNRGFLKNRIIQYTLLFLFTAVIILRYNHKTFFFTHIMLAMVFFSEMKNKTVRNILIIVFIILGYEGIKITLVGGRDIMVSSFIAYAFIFVVLMGGFLCSKIKGNHKLAIVGTFFLITAVIFIWKIHNFDNVKSLSEWGLLLERYKNISQIIEKKESTFEYSNPPVKIYDTTRDRKRNVKVIPQLPFGLKLFGNMEQKRAVTTAVSVKNDAPREKTNTAVYSKDAVPSEKIVAVVATVPH